MATNDKRKKRKGRDRKDRVLQARIPESLDEELRDRAESLGLSVSTIVRNVLFNTFDLVEGVVSDSTQLARVIKGEDTPPPGADPIAADGLEGVIGWQEAVLNRNGICEQCNAILKAGDRAAIGLPVQTRPVLLCQDCLASLTSSQSDTTEES